MHVFHHSAGDPHAFSGSERRLIGFAETASAVPVEPLVPEAPKPPPTKVLEKTDTQANQQKRVESATADDAVHAREVADSMNAEWNHIADEKNVGPDAKKLMKRPHETPASLQEFAADRLYVRECGKYAEATDQWNVIPSGIRSRKNPNAVYLYKRSVIVGADGKKEPCLLAYAPDTAGAAPDCQMLTLATGTWTKNVEANFAEEFKRAALDYPQVVPPGTDVSVYQNNLDVETSVLKNPSVTAADIAANHPMWNDDGNHLLRLQFSAYFGMTFPVETAMSPETVRNDMVQYEVPSNPDAFDYAIPNGEIFALTFDRGATWQYLMPDMIGIGDIQKNGFRVERTMDGKIRVITAMPYEYALAEPENTQPAPKTSPEPLPEPTVNVPVEPPAPENPVPSPPAPSSQ